MAYLSIPTWCDVDDAATELSQLGHESLGRFDQVRFEKLVVNGKYLLIYTKHCCPLDTLIEGSAAKLSYLSWSCLGVVMEVREDFILGVGPPNIFVIRRRYIQNNEAGIHDAW